MKIAPWPHGPEVLPQLVLAQLINLNEVCITDSIASRLQANIIYKLHNWYLDPKK